MKAFIYISHSSRRHILIGQWLLNNNHKVSELIMMCYVDNTENTKILSKIKEDTNHHLKFLAHALLLKRPKAFINYTKWLREILIHLNFKEQSIVNSYEFIKDALTSFHSTDNLTLCYEYIDLAIEEMSSPLKDHDKEGLFINPLKEESKLYTQLLINDKKSEAFELLKYLLQDHSLESLYVNVLQESLYEIGNLWQERIISVAQEHAFVSFTEEVMAYLTPMTLLNRNASNIMTCSIGLETHDIGIRMISNLIRKANYNNIHLGANTPIQAILDVLDQEHVEVIVISATMLENVYDIKCLIERLKAKDANVKVLVGGHSFNQDPSLWQHIGADGYSKDAKEALKLINEHLSA